MTPLRGSDQSSTIKRPELPAFDLDLEIVRALHWCRLGRVRPHDDSAFHRAKQLGLLAQDSVWRTTEQGDGVLVALGLLKGKPEPRRTLATVLWAACDRYPQPQFVMSWSEGLDDAMVEEADRLRATAEDWFRGFEDIDWRFWTTTEYIDVPEVPNVVA